MTKQIIMGEWESLEQEWGCFRDNVKKVCESCKKTAGDATNI